MVLRLDWQVCNNSLSFRGNGLEAILNFFRCRPIKVHIILVVRHFDFGRKLYDLQTVACRSKALLATTRFSGSSKLPRESALVKTSHITTNTIGSSNGVLIEGRAIERCSRLPIKVEHHHACMHYSEVFDTCAKPDHL